MVTSGGPDGLPALLAPSVEEQRTGALPVVGRVCSRFHGDAPSPLPGDQGQVNGRIVPVLCATLEERLATLQGQGDGVLPDGRSDGAHSYRGRARDDGAHGLPIGNVTANVLLVIGYPLALGVLARLRPVLTERRVWWFATLEAATASITAGWFLHGRPVPAAINGAALVGFAITWLITGQRADPPATEAS